MALDTQTRSAKSSAAYPNEKRPVQEKKQPVTLKPKDVKLTTGEIPMHELLKAQKKIEENNKKAGISKEPLSRPRSKQTLPIANK